MGTQVITRDTGRRLGVVGEVMVDIDRREVVALGLRDNPFTRFLPGLPRWMLLEQIRQVGDVILVDSADSLAEGFDPERYSKVINCQVVSESGVQLGRVLGFSFDIETGELTTLVIGALGVPLLGEGVLSTWELPVGEIGALVRRHNRERFDEQDRPRGPLSRSFSRSGDDTQINSPVVRSRRHLPIQPQQVNHESPAARNCQSSRLLNGQ